MGPIWGPPGSYRPQMGPMLAPGSLLSGLCYPVQNYRGHSENRPWICISLILVEPGGENTLHSWLHYGKDNAVMRAWQPCQVLLSHYGIKAAIDIFQKNTLKFSHKGMVYCCHLSTTFMKILCTISHDITMKCGIRCTKGLHYSR